MLNSVDYVIDYRFATTGEKSQTCIQANNTLTIN